MMKGNELKLKCTWVNKRDNDLNTKVTPCQNGEKMTRWNLLK